MGNTRRFPLTMARARQLQMGVQLRVEPYDPSALGYEAREHDITLADKQADARVKARAAAFALQLHKAWQEPDPFRVGERISALLATGSTVLPSDKAPAQSDWRACTDAESALRAAGFTFDGCDWKRGDGGVTGDGNRWGAWRGPRTAAMYAPGSTNGWHGDDWRAAIAWALGEANEPAKPERPAELPPATEIFAG